MKLTKREQVIILRERQRKDESKPKKTAVSKHDLFYLSCGSYGNRFDFSDSLRLRNYDWFVGKKLLLDVVEEIKQKLLDTFVIPKGTQFICYIEDGEERWYGKDNRHMGQMDSKWAAENLINIKTVGKI
jgi:hypothetical protein